MHDDKLFKAHMTIRDNPVKDDQGWRVIQSLTRPSELPRKRESGFSCCKGLSLQFKTGHPTLWLGIATGEFMYSFFLHTCS